MYEHPTVHDNMVDHEKMCQMIESDAKRHGSNLTRRFNK